VTAISFLPSDPDTFAIGTDTGAVSLCSAVHGVVWATLSGHEGPITGLEWAMGEGYLFLVTVSADKSARVWLVTLPTFELPPPVPLPQSDAAPVSRGRQLSAGSRPAARSSSLPHESQRMRPPIAEQRRDRSRDPAADAALRSVERACARSEMVAADAADREQEQRLRGPQAKGGDAACVQVIATDFVLTHIAILPQSPSLFVAAGVEEADYFAMEELQARTKNALAAAAREQAEFYASESSSSVAPQSSTSDDAIPQTGEGWPQGNVSGNGSTERGVAAPTSVQTSLLQSAGEGGATADTPAAPVSPGSNKLFGAASLVRKGLNVTAAIRKGGDVFGDALKKGRDWTDQAISKIDQAVGKFDQALTKTASAAAAGVGMLPGAGAGPAQSLGVGPGGRALMAAATFQAHLAQLRATARGYIVVFDSVSGRTVQTRLVQGVQVDPTTLARPASFPTALAFSTDGAALYVADARGLVHLYEVETDTERLASASEAGGAPPLKEHSVLFGEQSALISGLRRLGDAVKGAVEAGGGAGLDSLGAAPNDNGSRTGGEGAHPEVDLGQNEGDGPAHFTSLFFKHDHVLNAPLLLGLDSANRVRALTVPAAGSALAQRMDQLQAAAGDDDVARAAFAAVGMTTKAGAFLVRAGVGVATLGALQVNMQAQSAELEAYIKYNSSYNSAVGGGGGGGTGLLGTGQAHVAIAPVPARDAIVAANASGEVFVLEPHSGTGQAGAGPQQQQRRLHRLHRGRGAAIALAAAAHAPIGSGVAERHVVAKLSLAQAKARPSELVRAPAEIALRDAPPVAEAPAVAVAVARGQRYIAVALADQGQVVVWERVSAESAEVDTQ
jgi:hypothetical protein